MAEQPGKPAEEAQIGLIEAFLRLFRRRRLPVAVTDPLPVIAIPETIPFIIGLAQLHDDNEDTCRDTIVEQLENRTGIRIKVIDRSIQVEEGADPLVPHGAFMNARYMAAEEGVDVLVWGEMVMDSLRLHFTSPVTSTDERPGSFTVFSRLFTPINLDQGYGDFVFMSVLAACDVVSAPHHMPIRHHLPPAITTARAWLDGPPFDLEEPQRRDYWTMVAHACAVMGNQTQDPAESRKWYQDAADLYKKILEMPAARELPAELSQIRRHIAAIHLMRGENSDNIADMELAINALREILDGMVRANNPQEWANTQNRLGMLLYKLDIKTGKTEPLKDAIAAFQAALQVYTRYEHPNKWGDIMHSLAQATEIYGDQLKSPEVLARAVDTCRQSLEVRNRDVSPLVWAATMNTLGAALFLMDKHTPNSTANLEEATRCLQAAIEVFTACREEQWKEVAAKNLGHINALRALRRGRRVADPTWAGVVQPPSRVQVPSPQNESEQGQEKTRDAAEGGNLPPPLTLPSQPLITPADDKK